MSDYDKMTVAELKELLKDAGEVDRRHEAWLRSCAQYGSGLWLQAVPMLACFTASPDEYKLMVSARLLLPLYQSSPLHMPKCSHCKCDHNAGFVSGAHWHAKCKLGSVWKWIIRRHDLVRDILFEACKEVELGVVLELGGMYLDSKCRPADVLILPEEASQRARAVDVVVTDPRSKSAMSAGADKAPLAAAKNKEKKKLEDHLKKMAAYGPGIITFDKVPAALESSGAFGPGLVVILDELKKRAKGLKLQNYVRAEKPRTFSAFTFFQSEKNTAYKNYDKIMTS